MNKNKLQKIEILLVGEIHNSKSIIKKEIELVREYKPDLLFLEVLPRHKNKREMALAKLLKGKIASEDYVKVIEFDRKGSPSNMIDFFDFLHGSKSKVFPLDYHSMRELRDFELDIIRNYRAKKLSKVKNMIIERDFRIFQERENEWTKNILAQINKHNPKKIMCIVGANHLKRYATNLQTNFLFDVKTKSYRSKKTLETVIGWAKKELKGKDILKLKDPCMLLVDVTLYEEVLIPLGFSHIRK